MRRAFICWPHCITIIIITTVVSLMTDKVERVAEMVWIARQRKRDPSEPSPARCIFKHDAQKVLKGIPPYSVLHIISRKCWSRWLLENLIMRIQQNIKRCKEQILYFCKEGPSYENNIANPSQQRISLVMQQRHAGKHSDNTSLVTGDPSFMLVSHNIPHYHCSRCSLSPFKKRGPLALLFQSIVSRSRGLPFYNL